ncbi:hypothetical protein FQR65_LT16420 [Abscondita terminalis]|nr:hypothetical protein FQR65_LT16420 [Abscondita terminalis]
MLCLYPNTISQYHNVPRMFSHPKYNIHFCSVIVNAVDLHNIAKYLNDQLPNDEEEVAAEDHDGEEVVEDNDELNNDRQCGQQRREEIKNIIFQLQFAFYVLQDAI